MWTLKKGAFSSVALLIIALFSIEAAAAAKKICVLRFSEQARYVVATKGFLDSLKEAGLGEPQTEITIEDAGANKAVAAELVKKMAAAKLDLIFTVGTHATLAVVQEIKDVPIVFAQVYDPVEAGIAKSWQSSGNNTTGASTKIPMSRLIESLKRLKPVDNLAVLYTPGEKNSESQLRDLREVQGDFGIKVVPVPLAKVEEIGQLLPVLIARTDALFITGSNFINSQLPAIVDITIKGKIPTVSHLEDLVEQGVLLGVCPNSYLIGRLAGEKAIRILNGEQPSSIPIEALEQFDVIINMKTAKAGGFQIPPEFMKTVGKTIE
jgi:putative tryptophan/tyrosine transport system substrate-binding protein